MKPLASVIIFFAILVAGCAGGSGSHQKMSTGKAIDVTPDQLSIKLDPVCQMSMDQFPIADTMTYNGKLYGFCNAGCKQEFAKEPEKFLSELPKR